MKDVLQQQASYSFLSGGGKTGALIRSIDWTTTPLGSPAGWPQNLKTCVRIILTSRQPMFVWWGKELINIYNDAYIDIVRGKHPEAMGQPAQQVWREIWDKAGPRAEAAMRNNEGTYDEALLLIMERNGYPEETYYTFSYSPVPGEDGEPAGIICANTDDTERIIGERQLRTLKDLAKNIIHCKTRAEVFGNTINVLRDNPQDFPFALLYGLEEGDNATLLNSTEADPAAYNIPMQIDLTATGEIPAEMLWAAETGQIAIIEDIGRKLGDMPKGFWEKAPDKVLILPIAGTAQNRPFGFLVVGLNPYRQRDETYLDFFRLVSDQIATSLGNVHVYEAERRRAEALAEIDQAKTVFFSNISHEFRTPLTLMLSPLQEIRRMAEELPLPVQDNIDITYRNTLRLQKLVNTLLDFSRIEAGKMQAQFQPVDLPQVTRDLASAFRSAIEKAGMELIVDIDHFPDPVFVDHDMWEKIVLNLISNAFKYTTKGSITVRLKKKNDETEFSVEDTGVGIPPDEINRVFERFHRVHNLQGRTQEGTGIGLSLVQELVKLHQGTIDVRSESGRGTCFTVRLPLTKTKEKVAGNKADENRPAVHRDAFLEEAMKWLPQNGNGTMDHHHDPAPAEQKEKSRPRILLADDNADMRSYVQRLLQPHYDVLAAGNGWDALALAKKYLPDLIISDIMMPGLDGLQLVARLKSDATTRNISIILLSARAGEEATIEGLQAGVDDYLVKPFSARELLSRIDSNIRLSRSRQASEKNLYNLLMQAPVAISIFKGSELVLDLANDAMLQLWGKTAEIIGRPLLEALPEIKDAEYPHLLKKVYETGVSHYASEDSTYLIRNGKKEKVFFNFVYQPMVDPDEQITGVIAVATEVTDLVEARKKAQNAEERLRMAAEGTGLATWDLNIQTSEIIYSPRLNEIFGYDRGQQLTHQQMREHIHPEDRVQIVERAFREAMRTGVYLYEARVVWKDGSVRWIRTHGKVVYDEQEQPYRMLGTMRDITQTKENEIRLRESEDRYRQLAQELELRVQERTKDLSEANTHLARSNKELEQFAFVTSHDLQEPLRKIQTFANMLTTNYSDTLNDKAKGYLDKMLTASQRMSKLIHDLLNFSRLRQSEDGFIPTDLNEVLSNIQNDFELVIHQKEALITHEVLPTIEANPLQMNQLFYNLMSNALKFTQDNRSPVISINCRRAEPAVLNSVHGLNRNLPYYEIIIRDNGIGFAQEYAEKIFEIFQRLNARAEFEGTGIGLALVNKIVENHKGAVFAHSEEGKGASFHLLLPERQQ